MSELCPDPGEDEMHSGFMLGEINQDLFTVNRVAKEGWLLGVFSSVSFTSVPPVPPHYLYDWVCALGTRKPGAYQIDEPHCCTGWANWLLHPTVNGDANFDFSLVQL